MTPTHEGRAPILTGPRIRLRPHQRSDIPGLVAQCNDLLARRWTRTPQPYTTRDAEQFLEHITVCWNQAEPEHQFWAIDAEASGGPRYCGTIDLHRESPFVLEIAYGSHPAARGNGYMTDAVSLLCRHAFSELRATHIRWRAVVGNEASLRVAQRAGFTLEGTIRGLLPFPDGPRDGWIATLARDDLESAAPSS